MNKIRSNIRKLNIDISKITGIICTLILFVIFYRYTVFAFGLANQFIGAIIISLVLLAFIFILITEPLIDLIAIPLVCAAAIFVNSAVHNFEFHRGVIFNTFVSLLFYMYIFKKLNKSYTNRLIRLMMLYTLFMALAALAFTVSGIHYFFGIRVSTPSEYGYRTTSAFFTNGAYMGFYATFMLAVLFLTKKFSPGNFLIGALLFSMLVLSANRTALFGFFLILLLYIVYSKKISFPYKIFSLFVFLLFSAVFIYLWYNSLYNFKSPDSGRIYLIAKGMKLVQEGFFFGADQLMIDSKTHIAQIHNMYLAIIGEFGIFVLLAYLWFLGWIFKHSGKRGRIMMVYLFLYAFFHPGFYVGFSENFFIFLLLIIYLNHYEREQETDFNFSAT